MWAMQTFPIYTLGLIVARCRRNVFAIEYLHKVFRYQPWGRFEFVLLASFDRGMRHLLDDNYFWLEVYK